MVLFCKYAKEPKNYSKNLRIKLGIDLDYNEEILFLLKDTESRAASILPKAVYVDGSHDSYFLSENITSENFSFGFGGVAEIKRGQGLGFIVNKTRLVRLNIGKTGCLPKVGNS